MNRFIAYSAYILVLTWSVCSLMYWISPKMVIGPMSIGTIASLFQMLIEFLAVIVLFLNIKYLMNSKLNMAIFLWIVYTIPHTIITSDSFLLQDLRNVLWWALIYFLFYFLAFNDDKGENVHAMIRYFPVLFLVLLVQYLSFRATNIFSYSEYGRVIYGTSNAIYYNALMLPFAFLLRNRRLKYTYLIIGLILVLLSFKRSALIYTGIIFVIAIFYDFVVENKTNMTKNLLVSCLVLSLAFIPFYYIDSKTNGFISQRFILMEEDGGSGRTEIYENVWRLFENKPVEYKLMGSGYNTVIDKNVISGFDRTEYLSAHNDFLEVLYDFGIIGLIIYLYIIYLIFKRLQSLKRLDTQLYQANLAVFIIFMVMSMVSHLIIYPNYFAYLVIIWAITEGLVTREETLMEHRYV